VASGLASQRGLEFTGIYIGPILVFTLGMPVLRRIIDLAKTEKLTSVADFISARYGKNSAVGTIVALISLVGAIPYIALQLKSVSSTVTAMLNPSDYGIGSGNLYFLDLPLAGDAGACLLRHHVRHPPHRCHRTSGRADPGGRDGIGGEAVRLPDGRRLRHLVPVRRPGRSLAQGIGEPIGTLGAHYQTPISRWLTLTLLSAFAIIMLPRQFHVTVVENRTPKELRLAGLLFPLYLVAINIFVLPVAIGGLLTFGGNGNADLYMLSLPIVGQMPVMSLITFIGGFSAATAMVIVASVALSIMVSNDIVMPIFLRRKLAGRAGQHDDFAKTLLNIRRSAIFAVLLLGYAYYRSTDSTTGLASIGLLSFAAIAQMAPSLLGGLIWRRANARGAILGLSSGFVIWIYLLFLPSLGGPDYSVVASAVLGFVFPGTTLFTAPMPIHWSTRRS
jgi:Na+/proline symporter